MLNRMKCEECLEWQFKDQGQFLFLDYGTRKVWVCDDCLLFGNASAYGKDFNPIHACDVEESIKRAHIMQYGFPLDRCLGDV